MSVIVVNDDEFVKALEKKPPFLLAEFSRPGKNTFGEDDYSTRTGKIMDDLALEYDGKVVILRLPMESCEKTVKAYNVESVPTVIFFKQGERLETVTDFHLKFWFKTRLNEWLAQE
ncbi:thioredoxin 1 [Pseudomonas asturiensis]|uniref:Thioredoxin 1 n=1 Tax=Pseudomonas asturiensis TaxID=1190415 RepID=A0A1M7NXW1_9PSED|nr:thioredoxin domain-containing protein [Pseudomonas asturiensis]SHN08480.1 thioredoxin 1 [Pseudomonas asturiensis]